MIHQIGTGCRKQKEKESKRFHKHQTFFITTYHFCTVNVGNTNVAIILKYFFSPLNYNFETLASGMLSMFTKQK